jgi:hypothetical protein
MRSPFLLASLGLLLALHGCTSTSTSTSTSTLTSADRKVAVTQLPISLEKHYFDRAVQTPSQVSVDHNQSANTNWDFHCRPRFQFDLIEKKTVGTIVVVKIKVKSAQVEISAPITIYLPSTAKPEVLSHEDGHVKICRQVYESVAGQAALSATEALIGKEFKGSGKTLEEACQLALNRAGQELGRAYRKHTVEVVNLVSAYYDQFALQHAEPQFVDSCVEAAFHLQQGKPLRKVEQPPTERTE